LTVGWIGSRAGTRSTRVNLTPQNRENCTSCASCEFSQVQKSVPFGRVVQIPTNQRSARIRVPHVPNLGHGKATNLTLRLHPGHRPSIYASSTAAPLVRLRLPTIPLFGRTLAEGWRGSRCKMTTICAQCTQNPLPLPLMRNYCYIRRYAYKQHRMNSL